MRNFKMFGRTVCVAMFCVAVCSCGNKSLAVSHVGVAKERACIALLERCAEDGILDGAGVVRFGELQRHPSELADYNALIDECAEEENFYDTVGGSDEYDNYVSVVLERCAEQ